MRQHRHSKIALLLLCLVLAAYSSTGFAATVELDRHSEVDDEASTSRFKPYLDMKYELGLAFTGITLWGINRWDWFQNSMRARNEYGFSKRSSTGGADKTGHFVSAYFLSRFLTYSLERRSYEHKDAAFHGAMGALALMTWIEIGDATCKYGFSVEDQIANMIGVYASYLSKAYPSIGRKINIRLEYWPTSTTDQNTDLVADYSGMKHLIALRAAGFARFSQSPLRFFELHLGFYSRGYRSFDQSPRERVLYTAIGIDLNKLLNPIMPGNTSRIFEFYQPPKTYVEHRLLHYQDDPRN